MTVFLAILGWLVLIAIMIALSVLAFGMCFNNLGQYNIGGVPNSILVKLGTIVFILVVLTGWYGVFLAAPFSIDVKL